MNPQNIEMTPNPLLQNNGNIKNNKNKNKKNNKNNSKKNNNKPNAKLSNIKINEKLKNNKEFTSQNIILIKDPAILRNNKEFPTFEYEGGDGFQCVKMKLNTNHQIRADGGTMNYMSGNIKMETKLLGGGLFNFFGKAASAVGRTLSGSSAFYNIFHTTNDKEGFVNFSSVQPGNVGCFYIPAGKNFSFVSDTYICSTPNLEITTNLRMGGFLLGYGLAFVKVTANNGHGLVWCGAFGNVIDKKLAPDESIKIDNGVLLGFDSNIKITSKSVGGFKSFLFSGEGIVSEIHNDSKIPIDIYLQSRSKIFYNDYISDIAKKAVGK